MERNGRVSRILAGAGDLFGRVPAPLLLCALVLPFLLPALRNGFVDWDDVQYVLANPALRGSWLDALGFSPGYYHPLTTLTYKLEFSLFGPLPLPFHLTNLALHLANCVSVLYLLAALGADRRAAFTAALLFGLHPVHAEPAAWVSGRKELLWTFFSAWTMITYLRYSAGGSKKHFAASLGLFLLAVLSKPFAMVIPFVLLLIDRVRGRGDIPKMLLEKAPYLAIALPLLTLSTGSSNFLFAGEGAPGLAGAAAAALANAGFYARKLAFPSGLSALYPQADLASNAAGLALLLAAAAAAVKLPPDGRGRRLTFGLGLFMLTLLPALPVSPPADRYAYLPALGLFCVYAELVWLAHDRLVLLPGASRMRGLVPLALTAHIITLGLLSAARLPAWKDSLTLWNDVISKYPGEHVAYYGRGNAFGAAGQNARAVEDYTRCLELEPSYWKAMANRGRAYDGVGEYAKAIADYSSAIAAKPGEPRLYLNRGNAWLGKGDALKAIADYEKALEISPGFAPAAENRLRALRSAPASSSAVK